jgi:hypothetical protein
MQKTSKAPHDLLKLVRPTSVLLHAHSVCFTEGTPLLAAELSSASHTHTI